MVSKKNIFLLSFLFFGCLVTVQLMGAQSTDSEVFIPILRTVRGFEANPLPHTFNFVTDITHAGDERLFVVEVSGVVKVVQSDGTVSTFLDIQDRVVTGEGETGMFGLAFHPDYANNGYFYVSYFGTEHGEGLHVMRFEVSADKNVANPNSGLLQVMISMVEPIHNGGALRFNKDGYLYLGVGDDQNLGNAQSDSLKGKLLRIDVDDSRAGVEIWAKGLRNPWRIGVDPISGVMFIGDVGDRTFEEVNIVPFGVSGLNYGWPCFEGTLDHLNCDNPSRFIPPTYEYDHSVGCSITGGEVVRRGDEYYYLFGDFCLLSVQSLRVVNGSWQAELEGYLPPEAGVLITFGRNNAGTVFAGTERTVYELYIPPRD